MSEEDNHRLSPQMPGDPIPQSREEQIAELVAVFWDQSGEAAPSVEEYCRQHPELGDELRAELESVREVDSWFSPAEAGLIPAAELPLPERLSGHRIEGIIGEGGMGRVLMARDERLGRRVAIKTLHPRFAGIPELKDRFMREARSLATLNHPDIVRIFSLGGGEEIPHFIMEYVEGKPLTEAARPLALEQKLLLLYRVVEAVAHLHQHNLVHRDLKPGNILVTADLHPKVLDLGLARPVEIKSERLTRAGQQLGTLEYFSPEQAAAREIDARSDVFSLGVVCYEILTGVLPFQGEKEADRLRAIHEADPVWPRRLNPALPRPIQDICLKAMEREPSERYASAKEMADDLERFLSGEPVIASPTVYGRSLAGKIEKHLRELEGWVKDQIISPLELDSFRKLYDRLVEREDSWILEARRLSWSQVSLYLGGWLMILGTLLLVLFEYTSLAGIWDVGIAGMAGVVSFGMGIRCWQRGDRRFGVAYLLAFGLLVSTTALVTMSEFHWATQWTRGREDLEFFKQIFSFDRITNAQLWWALLLALLAFFGLRRFTGSTVFSLGFSFMAAQFGLATLLRLGLLEWIEKDRGRIFYSLLPIAAAYFMAGFFLERMRLHSDSRYFYPSGVFFTYLSLSGLALYHQPWADWLRSTFPWTRGEVEYLFMLNAGIYLGLQWFCERFPSAQLRMVAKAFRFVIPGHLLMPLLLLGIQAADLWSHNRDNPAFRLEARTFEILLPAVALGFVYGSIPKQMKNYFASGLLFFAVGVIRLAQDLFEKKASLPVILLAAGIFLMLVAGGLTWIPFSRRFLLQKFPLFPPSGGSRNKSVE
jgi:serine/threonine-protein kinase